MASAVSLIDTGPLLAALDRAEPHHQWAASLLARIAPPLLTYEAGLSEAAFLLRLAERFPDAQLLTLDSDFRIYRAAGQRPLQLLTPSG